MGALIAIAVVIVVLVLLLIGLGVFVAILLLWTYKHRSGSDQSNHKFEVYETIKDPFRRNKKKNKNGGPLTEEAMYQRRSYAEEEKVTLPEILNSESNAV